MREVWRGLHEGDTHRLDADNAVEYGAEAALR